MTIEQFNALIAEAQALGIPGDGRRWAWNQAHSRGLHPELSDIPAPAKGLAEKRQSANDWHDDRTISRSWLSRKA